MHQLQLQQQSCPILRLQQRKLHPKMAKVEQLEPPLLVLALVRSRPQQSCPSPVHQLQLQMTPQVTPPLLVLALVIQKPHLQQAPQLQTTQPRRRVQ